MKLKEFEQHIGVKFKRRRLLRQALTHRSYINENLEKGYEDNERLEYLGDAVLDFLTAEMLFTQHPDMSEGVMTRLRSALVRTESLAKLAVGCRLGEVIYMGKGEDRNGGRERINILCQTFEALVGAMYLDRGLDTVRNFVIPKLTDLQEAVWDEAIHKDARSQFQEWSQAVLNVTPDYRDYEVDQPYERNREFQVGLWVWDEMIALGTGRTKHLASHDAARLAMRRLDNNELSALISHAEALQQEQTLAESEPE